MVTETDRNKARSAVVSAYHALDCVTIPFSFLHALADAAVDAVSTGAEPDGWICENDFTLEPDLAWEWEDKGLSPTPFYFSPQSHNAEPVKTAPAVAVKALDWRDRHDIPLRANDLTAESVVGQYAIRPSSTGKRFLLWMPGMDYDKAGAHFTVESAKVDAQADYEARILSALSAQVQDVAVQDVVDELRRQVEVEGWSADHDDTHDRGEMAGAAACYALAGVAYVAPDHYPPRKKYAAVVDARNSISEKERETTREAIKLALGESSAPRNWPWDASWWKPTNTRRNLVKAAALLISEIKRLDRAAAVLKKEG